jgi:hypothetical protein
VLFLLKPHGLRIKVSGWKPAVAVGAAGGIIGGFAAFPGSMPVVYLGLRGVSKANTRGITQPYILARLRRFDPPFRDFRGASD